jgi:hypothetical protein
MSEAQELADVMEYMRIRDLPLDEYDWAINIDSAIKAMRNQKLEREGETCQDRMNQSR